MKCSQISFELNNLQLVLSFNFLYLFHRKVQFEMNACKCQSREAYAPKFKTEFFAGVSNIIRCHIQYREAVGFLCVHFQGCAMPRSVFYLVNEKDTYMQHCLGNWGFISTMELTGFVGINKWDWKLFVILFYSTPLVIARAAQAFSYIVLNG